ncbi:hypothetical protein ES703_125617 [subsurface metagenome]
MEYPLRVPCFTVEGIVEAVGAALKALCRVIHKTEVGGEVGVALLYLAIVSIPGADVIQIQYLSSGARLLPGQGQDIFGDLCRRWSSRPGNMVTLPLLTDEPAAAVIGDVEESPVTGFAFETGITGYLLGGR